MTEPYTPEGYTLATWRGAEAAFKGELREPENAGPPPEPHPNELVGKTIEQWYAERGLSPVNPPGSG